MTDTQRISLSFRQERQGGDVKMHPDVSDDSALNNAQHVVLLIHGYNNDHKAAAEAYDGFHARQKALGSDERYGLGRTFVEVYWPGDAKWGVISFLYYMGSIGHAKESAIALARFLRNRLSGARIDIVAHSMGCRVALETLWALNTQNETLNFGRIVFMAGAVPTFMLVDAQPKRRLRPAYDRVLREGALSLFSGSDMVLAGAFPAGQSLAAGEEGATPTALGHEYWIDSTVPYNLGQEESPRSGHSDYWGWNTEPKSLKCAQHAARKVHDYLQFPSAGSRTVGARPLVEASASKARALAQQREIEAREMQFRAP